MTQGSKVTGKLWIALLSILTLLGIGFYIRQLNLGLITTGMDNTVSWGLYIITFAFLVGLSAGGLIVSSMAYVLKLERLEKMAPIGIIAAVACVIGAIGIIIIDVGQPLRIYHILIGGNFTSPITWDFFILPIYLILGLVELYLIFSKKWRAKPPQERHRAMLIAAWIGLPVAILVHSVTAWIFGLQIGRHFWNTALMAPLFISSAIVSGVGLLLVIAYIGRRFNLAIPGLDEENTRFLTKFLAAFIVIDAFFLFCEIFTVAYGGGGIAAITSQLLTGPFAIIFWPEVILGILLPLLLLSMKGTRSVGGLQATAGILVMLGVFAKRINIILPNLLNPNINDAPGISTGRYIASPETLNLASETSFSFQASYGPTTPEVIITVGVLSLVALIITVGIRWILSFNSETYPSQEVSINQTNPSF